MTIATTNIGGGSSAGNGANPTLSIGVGGVPAGAGIIVFIDEGNVSSVGTVTDTAGNTYTPLLTRGLANGSFTCCLFYAENCLALSNGNSITYHLFGSTTADMVGVYATGLAASGSNDAATNASGLSTSSTPTVTSGTASHDGELFVGFMCWSSFSTTATQDSTNGAWVSTPTAGHGIIGGTLVQSVAGTQTYAPTLSASKSWVTMIAGFTDQVASASSGNMLMVF